MRILFLGFGLPPYFRDILNRLNEADGIEVFHVRPAGRNRHLGTGVVETDQAIRFHSTPLVERDVSARRLFGLSDFEIAPSYTTFEGLAELMEEWEIDQVVVQAIYHNAFVHEASLKKTIRKLGIRTIFHNIPFQMPSLPEALNNTERPERLALDSLGKWGVPIKWLGLDRLYASQVRRRTLRNPVRYRKRALLAPDAHVIYHEAGAEIYQSYGVKPEKIHVVRNSTDTDALDRACRSARSRSPLLPPNPTRILHVGRLVPWKRVDLLIAAVSALKQAFPGIELLVVGDGPEKSVLEKQAEEAGASDCVSFAGPAHDPEDLAQYLTASSLYVLAGMGGLSINDAMAAGLPVICSRCDGTEKFLVRDGQNGFYFREGDGDDLAAKIGAVLRDPQRCHAMGEESRRIIREELNLDILVENYRKVFDQLR